MAQQPGLAWGSGGEAWPGGPLDPQLLTLLAALGPSLHQRFALFALCSFLSVFLFPPPLTLKLHLLTEGLRPSEVTARGVSAHLAVVPCSLHLVQA